MNKEKTIRVERLELIDKWGRTRAVFGAENGVPYMRTTTARGESCLG
jgi:hypothetical protein